MKGLQFSKTEKEMMMEVEFEEELSMINMNMNVDEEMEDWTDQQLGGSGKYTSTLE